MPFGLSNSLQVMKSTKSNGLHHEGVLMASVLQSPEAGLGSIALQRKQGPAFFLSTLLAASWE